MARPPIPPAAPPPARADAAGPPPAQVLTLLDDARTARAVLAISSALAQLMHRDLHLVYVEAADALAAAALPATRVLGPASNRWAPLAPTDVEQGWRIETERLRALAGEAALQRAVGWSLRVVRGALLDAARTLLPQSDLLLVAGSTARFPLPGGTACRTVTAVDDGTPAGAQALRVAARLATVLGARLRQGPAGAAAAPVDLLVLPHTLWAGTTAPPGQPRPHALLVGAGAGDAPH